MNKPDWWPDNPYSEKVFTMTEKEYCDTIKNEMLRSRIAGFLMREGFKVAEKMISEKWKENKGDTEKLSCKWELAFDKGTDTFFQTACGHEVTFFKAVPYINEKFRFCPYCGKEIETKRQNRK